MNVPRSPIALQVKVCRDEFSVFSFDFTGKGTVYGDECSVFWFGFTGKK